MCQNVFAAGALLLTPTGRACSAPQTPEETEMGMEKEEDWKEKGREGEEMGEKGRKNLCSSKNSFEKLHWQWSRLS